MIAVILFAVLCALEIAWDAYDGWCESSVNRNKKLYDVLWQVNRISFCCWLILIALMIFHLVILSDGSNCAPSDFTVVRSNVSYNEDTNEFHVHYIDTDGFWPAFKIREYTKEELEDFREALEDKRVKYDAIYDEIRDKLETN